MDILNKFPVYQLKKLLSQLKKENKFKTDAISTLKKKNVINYLIKYKYPLENLPQLEKKQYTNYNNPLKKYNTKFYDEEQQLKFIKQHDENIYQIIDPLQAKKEYFNKKSQKTETIQLLNHQRKFLRNFFLSNVSGSIVFHGVGSGKTLTAVVASHYYLSLYPKGNIIFISPPALILNFINSLYDYGLDIQDNRYSFLSFEKFVRQYNKLKINKQTLIIVDEAHILRTFISSNDVVDEKGEKIISINQNKRGYYILEGCKKADKCILLTGTPFINTLYDIENLLSMVSKKDPLDKNNFYELINNSYSTSDYFKYKISHYETTSSTDFKQNFPEKIEIYVPLIMSDKEDEIYNEVVKGNINILSTIKNLEKNGGMINFEKKERKKPTQYLEYDTREAMTAFHNASRQYSDRLGNKKINFIIDRIKNSQTTGQYIIYSTFIESGLKKLIKILSDNNIEYGVISGGLSNEKKEQSRLDYNNKKIQVLLITKAGTEGVDTQNTEAIFIMEGSQWNESLVNQAIARAIRYKSHSNLPLNKRKVWVYRLLLVKNNDVELINRINKGQVFNLALEYERMQNLSKKLNDKENEYVNFDKKIYSKLSQDEKKKYLSKLQNNRYAVDSKMNELLKIQPSIETKLCVMSLAKQEAINKFINVLDSKIKQLEDYESPIEKYINENLDNLTEKKLWIYQKNEINKQKEKLLNIFDKSDNEISTLQNILDSFEERKNKSQLKKDLVKRFQAFYTPSKLVKKMIDKSKYLNNYDENITILEPTAGVGNIVREIIALNKKFKIHMCEIEDKARYELKELCKIAPDILTLHNQGDFLKFQSPIAYDVVIMNPPFHLQKKNFTFLDRDYYDIDFVKRAYYMLKKNGELIALCRKENTEKEHFKKWLKEHDAIIIDEKYKNWEASKQKGNLSKIQKIDLSIIILYRKEQNENQIEENNILEANIKNNEEIKADKIEKFYYPVDYAKK